MPKWWYVRLWCVQAVPFCLVFCPKILTFRFFCPLRKWFACVKQVVVSTLHRKKKAEIIVTHLPKVKPVCVLLPSFFLSLLSLALLFVPSYSVRNSYRFCLVLCECFVLFWSKSQPMVTENECWFFVCIVSSSASPAWNVGLFQSSKAAGYTVLPCSFLNFDILFQGSPLVAHAHTAQEHALLSFRLFFPFLNVVQANMFTKKRRNKRRTERNPLFLQVLLHRNRNTTK